MYDILKLFYNLNFISINELNGYRKINFQIINRLI
jgi:hypothetical protein